MLKTVVLINIFMETVINFSGGFDEETVQNKQFYYLNCFLIMNVHLMHP